MFAISIDKEKGLLRMTLSGFFSVDDVRRLDIERQHALKRLALAPNRHLTLCDLSSCDLSVGEVVEEFRSVIGNPRFMSRRLAMVVQSALATMQTRRAMTRDNASVFASVAEAEAWLLADTLARPVAIKTSISR